MNDESVTFENAHCVVTLNDDQIEKLKHSPFYDEPDNKINLNEKGVLRIGMSIIEFKNCFPDVFDSEISSKHFERRTLGCTMFRHLNVGKVCKPLDMKKKKADLEARAIEHFAKFEPLTSHPPTATEEGSIAEIFLATMAAYKGLCIGERHEAKAPKKLLIDAMPSLKEIGVTVIYLEHLFTDGHQDLLDQYYRSDSHVLPYRLYKHLEWLDCGNFLSDDLVTNPYSFMGLVIAAKVHGIRIVPIDSSVAYDRDQNRLMAKNDSKKRCYMMSYLAAKQFENHPKEDKYLFLVGSMHINSANSGVPGITEITGAPTIVVGDGCQDAIIPADYHRASPHLLLNLEVNLTKEAEEIAKIMESNAAFMDEYQTSTGTKSPSLGSGKFTPLE